MSEEKKKPTEPKDPKPKIPKEPNGVVMDTFYAIDEQIVPTKKKKQE